LTQRQRAGIVLAMALAGRLRVVPRTFPDGVTLARKLGISRERVEQADGLDDAWQEIVVDEQWLAAVRLAMQDGRVVVSEVRVFPREREPGAGVAGLWSAEVLGPVAVVPRGGLTSRLLRKVPLGEVPAHVVSVLSAWDKVRGPLKALASDTVREGFPGVVLNPRPRPERASGRPDVFYAQLAAAYVRAVTRGSRHPVAELAARRGGVDPAKVRDMLHEARERGLLSEGTQGKAEGHLLPRAKQILRLLPSPKRRRRNR
jgi:hypothetical protein